MKHEPCYSIRDYAEYKGLTDSSLRTRMRIRGVKLDEELRYTVQREGKKRNTPRYRLSYLEKALYSLTDGWEPKK